MFRPKGTMFVLLVTALTVIAPFVSAQETKQSPIGSGQVDDSTRRAEREAMYYRYLEFASYIKGGSIEPHWMVDGSSFWCAEGPPDKIVIWKVAPKANTKTPLFDTPRLRQSLRKVLGHEPLYRGLPFADFIFVDGEKAVKFTVENKEFILHLNTYTLNRAPSLSEEDRSRLKPQAGEVVSPDGRWFVGVKDDNLWLRSARDGSSTEITTDGIPDCGWTIEGARWAPDSRKIALKKVDDRKVRKIPIVHYLNSSPEVEWVPRGPAGGSIPQTELFVVDILSKLPIRVETGNQPDQDFHIYGWRPDGSELIYARINREHNSLDLMASDSSSGTSRLILSETQKTFIERLWFRPPAFILLQDGRRFVWASERDGWNHLYLYTLDGTLIRRQTEGQFPVVQVVAVDETGSTSEESGWVYFTAHGDPQRLYDTHLYRVNLGGQGFTRLTEGPGQHNIQFSPSKRFFVDTHSTVARPPLVELRRADGSQLQTLSKANIDALIKDLKWSAPEEFVVEAADGKTDLHGVLYKPYDFDPNKRYPVIERIYAGPHLAVVAHTFVGSSWMATPAQALAQLGFVVFIVDGRGTPERSKEFQDIAYRNLGRHEIPDRVAVLKQLAEKRPYMDLNRVGIVGGSFGGYFAIRALLLAPDVYHVGVAGAPLTELSEDHAYEAYMGTPATNKDGYDYASNLRFASNLKGKLLLMHGTSDTDVPLSHSMRMVEALIRANKPFDLLVYPEQGHGEWSGSSVLHAREASRRYLQEHLKP